MSSKFSPDHYRQGIETWDYIVSQDLGYLEGNIIKYITRAGKKDNESKLDDLLKAKAYLTKLISTELDDTPEESPTVSGMYGPTDGSLYTYYSDDSTAFDR